MSEGLNDLRKRALERSNSGLRKTLNNSQKKEYSENVRQMYEYQIKTIREDDKDER